MLLDKLFTKRCPGIVPKEAHAACHPLAIITIQMRLIGLKLIHLPLMDFLHMVVTLDRQHTVCDCEIFACFLAVPTACIHAARLHVDTIYLYLP